MKSNVLAPHEESGCVETSAAIRSSEGRVKVKVLLLEDNPGDASLIELMLEESGGQAFEIEHVERLDCALERLARGGIALVLSDLSLSDSRGLSTFTQLHRQTPHVPIIVLSGLNDTSLAVQAVHEGAQDYLVKGQVNGQLLARSLHYAIERKQMSEQLARYAEELRSKNAQLEADFNMAREIQEIFLPHQFPTFPHSASPGKSALRFYQRYLPAAAVGGDFFDVFAITDTTAGLFICDVMGHGMRAALVTAIMRGLVEELIPVAADAGKFLTEINRSLHVILRRTREPFLATACYLVVDTSSGELSFANAGHPSPVRIRRDIRTVEPLTDYDARHGPALGLFDKSLYPICRSAMNINDLVILFTDGLYEVNSLEHGEYGRDRLLVAMRKRTDLPTERFFDELLHEIQWFSSSNEFEDDVCLVGVEFCRMEKNGVVHRHQKSGSQ